ncbi:hypothetical protein [Streptomyces johnsoniae]|uniref:Uncharacterized protein n=1 Tax=Streptomyces johnsoniae TaxID=3075532 RepID=A0ABU2SBP9_9ACTN|nr:hypothetical protein [Streptomyces sp. DSM 41886]MDT0446397.1 hypothetical protein [Streptomyces sp. DSM 41886]
MPMLDKRRGGTPSRNDPGQGDRKDPHGVDGLEGPDGDAEIDHMSGRASLYRDDRQVRTSDMPVRFPLGSDSFGVAASR